MRLLLDTHVLLWWLDEPSRLTVEARGAIRHGRNAVYVSAAVAWEIAIKKALGKLEAPDDLEAVLEVCRFRTLPITVAHAEAAGRLPDHHRDPFDRMLVAQARLEGLTVVSRDAAMKAYGVAVIEA